jgi:hypothetical protein
VATKEKQRATPLSFAQGIGPARNQLHIDGRLDFKRLLTEKEGVSKLTRWWIRSGKLNKFQLANELIK